MTNHDKLLQVQRAIPVIEKSASVKFGNVRFQYAPLEKIHEIVKPLLHEQGMTLHYLLGDGQIQCQIVAGEGVVCAASLPFTEKSDPKETGSMITYYKRYLLTSLLAIDSEEDVDTAVKPQKATLNGAAYDKAVERIKSGEKDVLGKCLKHFNLSDKQHDELLNLDLEYNG